MNNFTGVLISLFFDMRPKATSKPKGRENKSVRKKT
jgi:hypothetical protein